MAAQGMKTVTPQSVNWPAGPTRVVKTLGIGRPGTTRWADAFGHALVCVRHRRDRLDLVRYTTAEIVVDARPRQGRLFGKAWFGLALPAVPEPALRALLEANGGRWDAQEQLWRLRGDTIWRLGLVPCIVAL